MAGGADAHADSYVEALAREEIDGSGVGHDSRCGTGRALIYVGEDTGQNMIIVAPQANMRLTRDEVEKALDALAPRGDDRRAMDISDAVRDPIGGDTRWVARARQAGAMTILNPAPVLCSPRR